MPGMTNSQINLNQAYAECLLITKKHYENFPVISFMLTHEEKNHLAAIYAYARMADDVADEGNATKEQRIQQLQSIENELINCYQGLAKSAVFVALKDTINVCNIPRELLTDLLKAFRMDIVTKRHQTFQDLIYLSKYSANPIGRLVLLIFKIENKDYETYSDHICTALQLTNFWQDVSIDLNKNRIYIPQEELSKFNLTDNDIINKNNNQAFRNLMADLLQKTRQEYILGQPLLRIPDRRLRLYLKLIYCGGNKILDNIEHAKFDVLHQRVTLSRLQKLLLLIQAVT